MKINFINLIITVSCLFTVFTSCKKYLEAKPGKKYILPSSSTENLQALLDNAQYMNTKGVGLGEASADNYYVTDNVFESLYQDGYRNAYLWKPNPFKGIYPNSTGWALEYNTVYYANVVLDALKKINRTPINKDEWDNCRGSALVFRAKSFFEIAQVWTMAYDSSKADQIPGIPLRKSSEFVNPSVRSTLKETYEQMLYDLKTAIPLLPDLPEQPLRPSKAAAYALLARTYLILGDYIHAELYSDSCLQIKNDLMDFNTLDPNASYPFRLFNTEVIMHSESTSSPILGRSIARIDTTLYRSYNNNDLRKTLFFFENPDGSVTFKGNYTGKDSRFNGIATDEIYLIRAESEARLGKVADAMDDLNLLLGTRWKAGTFSPLSGLNSHEALSKILSERRRELIFRMLRFSDIKRLNKEGYNITLKRIIGGKDYTLPPNDRRYALPIPDEVIKLSGMQQN